MPIRQGEIKMEFENRFGIQILQDTTYVNVMSERRVHIKEVINFVKNHLNNYDNIQIVFNNIYMDVSKSDTEDDLFYRYVALLEEEDYFTNQRDAYLDIILPCGKILKHDFSVPSYKNIDYMVYYKSIAYVTNEIKRNLNNENLKFKLVFDGFKLDVTTYTAKDIIDSFETSSNYYDYNRSKRKKKSKSVE